MFVREKSARDHTYLYLVENEREGGRIRQRIIRVLGRKDVLLASGELDRLAASLVRHCDRAVIPGFRRGRLCPKWRRVASPARALVGAALGAARHCRGAGRTAREPRF